MKPWNTPSTTSPCSTKRRNTASKGSMSRTKQHFSGNRHYSIYCHYPFSHMCQAIPQALQWATGTTEGPLLYYRVSTVGHLPVRTRQHECYFVRVSHIGSASARRPPQFLNPFGTSEENVGKTKRRLQHRPHHSMRHAWRIKQPLPTFWKPRNSQSRQLRKTTVNIS